jgi:hypothetical protein
MVDDFKRVSLEVLFKSVILRDVPLVDVFLPRVLVLSLSQDFKVLVQMGEFLEIVLEILVGLEV